MKQKCVQSVDNIQDALTFSDGNAEHVVETIGQDVMIAVHAPDDDRFDEESVYEESVDEQEIECQVEEVSPAHGQLTSQEMNQMKWRQFAESLKNDPVVREMFGEFCQQQFKDMQGKAKDLTQIPKESVSDNPKPDKHFGVRGNDGNLIKSPSESMIYAPALNQNNVQNHMVDQISNFVESVRIQAQHDQNRSPVALPVVVPPMPDIHRVQVPSNNDNADMSWECPEESC